MACGASTSAYCHEGNVNKIWNNFNNLGMTVAESFIDGLSGAGVVPLCITMGGSDITGTPLYDATFTNQPNTSGSSHYHVMYPGGTASRWILPTVLVRIPKLLPRYRLMAPGPPARFRGMDLRSGRMAVAAFPAFAGGKAEVRHDELSGALYLKSVQRPSGAEPAVAQRVYLKRATALVRELGWENKELGQPRVTPLLTASIAAEGSGRDVRRGQAGVIVTWQRQIDAGGQRISVIGDGGLVRVSLSNGGSILHASRVWREIQAPSANVAIKTFEQARDEAIKKLRDPGAYKLDQWRWGYKELAGGARQDDMQIVFQFAFVPKEKVEGVPPNPPQMVEVSGELP